MHLSEAQTRELIDEQLRKVGWEANTTELRYSKGTRPTKGKNLAIAEWPTDSNTGNNGYADYALFIGEKLVGIVEAKKKHTNISSVLDGQCKDYAKMIKSEHQKYVINRFGAYMVPFLYATNGRPYIKQYEQMSGIWCLDVREPFNAPKYTGETEYFYRSVVCMIIGKSPHVILGQEMLKPRDGSGKDEGELTGGKRLIEQLKKRHGQFADVIVADALYLNAPFINTLKENGLEGVIRLKDERRMIFRMQSVCSNRMREKGIFLEREKKIEVWDLSGFKMEGCPYKLRVMRYHEQWEEMEKKQSVSCGL